MSSLDFPQIDQTQVALVRARRSTGQILDYNFELWDRSFPKERHTIFRSLDDAKDYINLYKDVYHAEFYVYDFSQELIYIYPPHPLFCNSEAEQMKNKSTKQE